MLWLYECRQLSIVDNQWAARLFFGGTNEKCANSWIELCTETSKCPMIHLEHKQGLSIFKSRLMNSSQENTLMFIHEIEMEDQEFKNEVGD